MKHVLLLSFFAILLFSCGEESKPSPAEMKITYAKINSSLLIPLAPGNEWTYEYTHYRWATGINIDTIKCSLKMKDKYYYDELRQKSFELYTFVETLKDWYNTPTALGYEGFFANLDSVVVVDTYELEIDVLYPYQQENLPILDYGFAIMYNYEVGKYTFDTVYVTVRQYEYDCSYMYYVKGVGLVHQEYWWKVDGVWTIDHDYKILSSTLK